MHNAAGSVTLKHVLDNLCIHYARFNEQRTGNVVWAWCEPLQRWKGDAFSQVSITVMYMYMCRRVNCVVYACGHVHVRVLQNLAW